jgi:trans-aconitate 2-methyltransferase
MPWDPEQYVRYADERGRPFHDLLARVAMSEPRRVVDLGCGPGTLTATLAERWPSAIVEGVDSSPEMIAAAAPLAHDRLRFRLGDVAAWMPPPDCDVVVSNATLQWVPTHRALLASWAAALPAGGWLAFQVPGNFASPSHTELRAVAAQPRWASALADVLRPDPVGTVEEYATLLLGCGLDVDVWESTYLHVLSGRDAVLEWMRGTALRPVLAALSPDDGAAFEAELGERLRAAYPATSHGTLFPFRRLFAVARRP